MPLVPGEVLGDHHGLVQDLKVHPGVSHPVEQLVGVPDGGVAVVGVDVHGTAGLLLDVPPNGPQALLQAEEDLVLKGPEAEQTTITVEDDKKKTYVTSGMSKLSRSERKIVSKILSIVTEIAPKDIAEQIIEKINQSCLLLFLANGRTAGIDPGLCRYCPCQH